MLSLKKSSKGIGLMSLLLLFMVFLVGVVSHSAQASDNFYSASPVYNVGVGASQQKVGDTTVDQVTSTVGVEWLGKSNWLGVDLGLVGVDTKQRESAYTADVKFGIFVAGVRPYAGVGYKESDLYDLWPQKSWSKVTYSVGVRYDVATDIFTDVNYKYSESGNYITTISTHYTFR